ncbi:MAG: hypothetical protein IKK63_08735 [Clostridia bacterium]|nr:hypothetical protein [Clostridia bacterium]MBR3818398.1 hypothetical protein [Clostridia bacterium]
MKKIISLLLILVFVLSGCNAAKKVRIDEYNWTFSRITSTETDKVIFTSEKNSSRYTEAKIINIKCTVSGDEITISDPASKESWKIQYTENKEAKTNNADGLIYDLTYSAEENSIKGFATTGIANMNDVDEDYYLILTIGGYELYFMDITD